MAITAGGDLRKVLMEIMESVASGGINKNDALAIASLAECVSESIRLEIKMLNEKPIVSGGARVLPSLKE